MVNTTIINNLSIVCGIHKRQVIQSEQLVRATVLGIGITSFDIEDFDDDWMNQYVEKIEIGQDYSQILFKVDILYLTVMKIEEDLVRLIERLACKYGIKDTEAEKLKHCLCTNIDITGFRRDDLKPFNIDTACFFNTVLPIFCYHRKLQEVKEPLYCIGINYVLDYIYVNGSFCYDDYKYSTNGKQMAIFVEAELNYIGILNNCDICYYILNLHNCRLVTTLNNWCRSVEDYIKKEDIVFKNPVYLYIDVRPSSCEKIKGYYTNNWKERMESYNIYAYIGEEEKPLYYANVKI